MNLKIDQISRDNIKIHCGVEYILIDDFFDAKVFKDSHEKFLSEYFIIDKLEHHYTLSTHPLMDILLENEVSILSAINTVWNETCIENKSCVNVMPTSTSLPIHNDLHWTSVPIRGILYLNGVCGTMLYSDGLGSNPLEVGGRPNQLFLFKVSDKSFHGVGVDNKTSEDRFVISMMFDREKDQI